MGRPYRLPRVLLSVVPALFLSALPAHAQTAIAPSPAPAAPTCARTIRANVVAFEQAYFVNRYGTSRPDGMLFALEHDVEPAGPTGSLVAGHVQLKSYKRPRPIVLRANVGDCLDITFRNLLAPVADPAMLSDGFTVTTRNASIHVPGLEDRDAIASEGTYAGKNPLTPPNLSGVVKPGGTITYHLYAAAEGAYLMYSTPGDFNNFGTMQMTLGLFGAVIVEPAMSEWYRSQVTASDLGFATKGHTADQHPILDYDAKYPPGNPRAGLPVLRMLDGDNRIVHSDLTAVITGPHRGLLPGGPGSNPLLPDRNEPFREVTVHYHESQDLAQPFPQFSPGGAVPSLNAGQDSFAINYGAAGIGAEVLANRIGVGPAIDCPECKFEEFFLSSWALGDPGIVVDKPADSPCTVSGVLAQNCTPAPGKKATVAYYADDPSNVYHSYVGDHVRFRVLHAGASVHHVHHHHAHQWLHSPDSDGSNYLDSQSIGPGNSFSAELVYGGSGNSNLTTGDSIFHCHFYPHFASGMWALYRVHDVFEGGTELDPQTKRPAKGARALPDGEIVAGTPIPAVVPLPTLAMAPMPAHVEIANGQVVLPADGFPGYPFYIPGIAGHRAPHPPLDFAFDRTRNETFDGGLPRHIITNGTVSNNQFNATDWSKDLSKIDASALPEKGTASEKSAFAFFGRQLHPSFTPDGNAANFRVNGLPRGPMPGAPFADPAVIDGKPVGSELQIYKGATLQLDAVFNKAGWHYPQQRIMSLWGDVQDLVAGTKPPEPLFFRSEANSVVEYWHTNLVPAYYELDDYEVRTPTDILGQHIHLVKFDVLASDGAANGFNYEDGTLSPEEVRGRIAAINAAGGLLDPATKTRTMLTAKAIPELGPGPRNAWVGAQATVQRWWIDPLLDLPNSERTYKTVFTHDHFGPSTHQMVGLYGGLLIEPRGTRWTSLDGKTTFHTRSDGGPTSYAANILDPANPAKNHREFAFAWGDLQHVYAPTSLVRPTCYPGQAPPAFDCTPAATYTGWSDPANVINCQQCSPKNNPPSPTTGFTQNAWGWAPSTPKPFLISDFGAGMISMNYRGEPLPLRVSPPLSGSTNPQADLHAADLAHSFRSIERLDPAFSTQPAAGGAIDPACTGAGCFTYPQQPISAAMGATDPYTPLLHAYEGDNVEIRLLSGSHTSMHDFNMHGVRWKFEPYAENSGYRNTQFIILSEHFEMAFQLPRINAQPSSDYLYNPTASYEGLTNGIWGLMRSWNPANPQPFLAPLTTTAAPGAPKFAPSASLSTNCANGAPCLREYEVHAMTAQQALQGAGLKYNSRGVNLGGGAFDTATPLVDPNAVVYVDKARGVAAAGLEPLVLRAAAGDWIHVKLVNDVDPAAKVFSTAEPANRAAQIPYANPYVTANLTTSTTVGLHAQLVEYDITNGDGMNVGNNAVQTAEQGKSVDYYWYAGRRENGKDVPTEFGAINLMPADPLMQVYRGLFGSLVIEPAGSAWITDPHSSAAATVFANGKVFREFVLMVQNDVDMKLNGSSLYAAGSPLSGFNYRSEPMFLRFGATWNAALGTSAPANWRNLQFSDVQAVTGLQTTLVDTTAATSNSLAGGDPKTPILTVPAGMPVRLRVLSPGGIGDNQQTFELTGHVWQEEPYTNASSVIGFNKGSNWTGTIAGLGPTTAYDVVLDSAGGRFRVPGDYLYRSWMANQFQVGTWGIFRVAPGTNGTASDTLGVLDVTNDGDGWVARGYATVAPSTRKHAASLALTVNGQRASVPVANGMWSYRGRGALPASFTVTSPNGGVVTWNGPAAAGAKTLEATAAAPVEARSKFRTPKPRAPK